MSVGETCQSTTQSRTCDNGSWSPDWPSCQHLNCVVETPASCQRDDIAVLRPSTQLWAVEGSNHVWSYDDGGRVYFGTPGDISVPADYDGDGYTDVAIFRPSSNLWAVNTKEDSLWSLGDGGRCYFGLSEEVIPVPGDYDGDGRADVAYFRPSQAEWVVRNVINDVFVQSGNSSNGHRYFGAGGDVPVPADYDGDGVTDIAIFRPSESLWAAWGVDFGGPNGHTWFGDEGDIAVPADYDGDGAVDIAIYRPSNNMWAVRGVNLGGPDGRRYFGEDGAMPVAADYDGDGKADLAYFNPACGTWAIFGMDLDPEGPGTILYFGAGGDVPLVGDFDGDVEPGCLTCPTAPVDVTADYDGDKIDDVASYDPSTQIWSISESYSGDTVQIPFCTPCSTPQPEDHDGDGKVEMACSIGGHLRVRGYTPIESYVPISTFHSDGMALYWDEWNDHRWEDARTGWVEALGHHPMDEEDFKNIKLSTGFNTIGLGHSHAGIDSAPWCEKYGLYGYFGLYAFKNATSYQEAYDETLALLDYWAIWEQVRVRDWERAIFFMGDERDNHFPSGGEPVIQGAKDALVFDGLLDRRPVLQDWASSSENHPNWSVLYPLSNWHSIYRHNWTATGWAIERLRNWLVSNGYPIRNMYTIIFPSCVGCHSIPSNLDQLRYSLFNAVVEGARGFGMCCIPRSNHGLAQWQWSRKVSLEFGAIEPAVADGEWDYFWDGTPDGFTISDSNLKGAHISWHGEHVLIVVNRDNNPRSATMSIDGYRKTTICNLVDGGEITVSDGIFSDQFGAMGVNLYSSLCSFEEHLEDF